MTTKKTSLTTLQIRLPKDLKIEAQKVFEELGTNLTDGMKMYLKYVSLNHEIPFKPSSKSMLEKLHQVREVELSEDEKLRIEKILDRIESGEEELTKPL